MLPTRHVRYGTPSFSPAADTNGTVGKLAWDGTLTIRTELKNVGSVAADEVVQASVNHHTCLIPT